jgi:uncharacterized protein with HEPN domain
MTPSRAEDYVDRIIEAAQHALRYVNGLSKSEFMADSRTQEAVIYNFFIIGEAATKLVKEYTTFVEHHDDIPWRSMRGMRNRIAHGYFDVDLKEISGSIRHCELNTGLRPTRPE